MASGSDVRPIDFANKIILLDGDIHMQIMGGSGTNSQNAELCRTMRRTMYEYNRNKTQDVSNAHMAFINAGSNLIRTNTYHALYPYLKSLGATLNQDDYTKTVEGAVKATKDAIKDYCNNNNILETSLNIVGTCGCFEDESINSLSPDQLRAVHRQRISILYNKGIRIVSLEGIRSYDEAKMLLHLLGEFPNIKSLVMFDGNKHINSLVCWIKVFYHIYGPQITAIGLSNIYNPRARDFYGNIITRMKPENLIPLVLCTHKLGNSWNPLNVNSNAAVIELKKFGIRYIGGGEKVKPEDIESVDRKLNPLPGVETLEND